MWCISREKFGVHFPIRTVLCKIQSFMHLAARQRKKTTSKFIAREMQTAESHFWLLSPDLSLLLHVIEKRCAKWKEGKASYEERKSLFFFALSQASRWHFFRHTPERAVRSFLRVNKTVRGGWKLSPAGSSIRPSQSKVVIDTTTTRFGINA